MKKRSLGVLRCCAVSAILFSLFWGIFQPVSAGSEEKPERQMAGLYEFNLTNQSGENSQNVQMFGQLDSDTLVSCQKNESDWSMHLVIDTYDRVMRGEVRFSCTQNEPKSEWYEYWNSSGTASIEFWDIPLEWNEQYQRWDIRGDTGDAQISVLASYQNNQPDIYIGGEPEIVDGGKSGTVPLAEVSGAIELEKSGELYLTVRTQTGKVVGGNFNLHVRKYDFSISSSDSSQPGQANESQQEEQPQLEEAPDLSDSPNARFAISAGCDDSIASGQDIDCRVNIQRDSEDVGGLMVVWVMDGFVANQELVLGDSATFNFPNPPPGSHTVQVQVIDSDTADVRTVAMGVEVGGFASPDEAPNRIPAGAQTASAVGTTALIGAWLWAEWLAARSNALADERQDAAEARDRQAWYEDQMARNDEVKARQQARQQAAEAHQQALEAEWKRYRNALLEKVKQYEKSEYLVDLLDDLQEVVYSNGKWDADGLQRLEGMINTRLVMDREDEVRAEWKRMWDFYKRQEAEANSILRGSAMTGVELVAGVLTQGAADLIFMPTKAIVSAVYARRRAMMLGKTGWDAAKSVMKESGMTLLTDYATGKATGYAVEKVIGGGAAIGKRLIGEEGVEALSNWWQRTGTKLGVIPKPAPKLPVIRQSWGTGPQVVLDRPIYRPGSKIPIGVGMENGLERIGRINSKLADDVRRMIDKGAQVDPHINNVLSPGNSSYTITPQDIVAKDLLNNSSYKQAVREGLIPPRVQQAVYQARDKIARNATMEAFQALDKIDLNGKAASSYIKNITVTGTGARPLNPRAVGRYTDWDATAVASSESSAVGQEAERLFAAKFNTALENAGVNAKVAEVNMFAGVRASDAPVEGGFSSEGLIHWQKVDMTYQGQSIVRRDDGLVMFNAHPDVEPLPHFNPHYPKAPGDIFGDARRLVNSDITRHIAETGGSLDPLTVLRLEGKQAVRVWKVYNTGRGADMPEWMKKVMQLKTDPNYHLSGGELDDVWQNYTKYLGLPSDLGGGK